MNLKNISLSFDETYHIYNGKPLYKKIFKSVMSFHPPGVAAIKNITGAYHIDLEGNPIYDKKFIEAFGYYDGIAAVMDESGWYHIDLKGEQLYNERYKWVGNFQEERCPVRDKLGKYFHIKKNGKPAYDKKYKYVGDFKYGIAVIYDNDGYARHINKQGKFIHKSKYRELGVFHKGFAITRDNYGAFHINKDGNPLYQERYQWVEPFYNEFSFVCKKNGEKLIINKKGEQIHRIYDESSQIIRKDLRQKLKGMLVGYWKTQIIYSIVKLGVLDKIKLGFNTFQKLLDKLKIPEPSLDMIIKVLKLWDFINEKNSYYTLKNLGYLLTEDYPGRLKYAALMWGDEHYKVMGKLLDALKSYKPQFKRIYNQEIFSYLNNNKDKYLIYNEAMKEYNLDYDNILLNYDFSDTEIILDVGGGSGNLLVKILQNNKNIKKGILFDLPTVINKAKETIKDDSIKRKIKFISGNFFEDIPVIADVVLMSRVIHDWNDQKALKILSNINRCLDDNGKLILFDMIVPENPKYDAGITLNFNLLVCVGGKERKLKDLNRLLKNAGFKILDVKNENGIISMIIAKKVDFN